MRTIRKTAVPQTARPQEDWETRNVEQEPRFGGAFAFSAVPAELSRNKEAKQTGDRQQETAECEGGIMLSSQRCDGEPEGGTPSRAASPSQSR
jgi:hypothetical protein